jgi:hypothetical protein
MNKSRREPDTIKADLLIVFGGDDLVYGVLSKKGLKTSKIARQILDPGLLASVESKPH